MLPVSLATMAGMSSCQV